VVRFLVLDQGVFMKREREILGKRNRESLTASYAGKTRGDSLVDEGQKERGALHSLIFHERNRHRYARALSAQRLLQKKGKLPLKDKVGKRAIYLTVWITRGKPVHLLFREKSRVWPLMFRPTFIPKKGTRNLGKREGKHASRPGRREGGGGLLS